MATSKKRQVEIDVLVDDKGARTKIAGIGDAAGTTAGKFDKLKGALGPALGLLGAREIGQAVLDMAKLAEQAAIAGESAEKVLGPALETLHTNLEETRLTLGLNSGELDTLAGKFGLLTEGFGLSNDAQAEFIEFLVKTGGELAAFRGNVGEAPEAIDAMAAAIRGEFDPLEQFGIKLSQAAINERALELAADPATAALSEQEIQIAAIQSLIEEKAAAAFGSLAEAQDTLAGKTNAATARFEDLKITLGEKLIPEAISLAEALLLAVDAMQGTADSSGNYWGKGAIADAIRDYKDWADAIKGAVDWLARLANDVVTNQFDNPFAGPRKGLGGGRSGFGGGTGHNFGSGPLMHSGGIVPGPPGADVPIIAQAGEEVTPAGRGGAGGGLTVNFYGTVVGGPAAARELAEMVHRELVRKKGRGADMALV